MTRQVAIQAAAVALLAGCLSSACWASGPPEPEHWSANRQYVLEVGWMEGEVIGLAKVGPGGKREHVWTRPYADKDRPPDSAQVADDGQHVVLYGFYHRRLCSDKLAFLGPHGEILRSYEEADLFTEKQALDVFLLCPRVWWRKPGWFAFVNEGREFAFVLHDGTTQRFAVATGEPVELDDKGRAEIRRLAATDVAAMLKDEAPRRRAAGATLAAALKAAEFVPDLKRLVADRTVTGKASSAGATWDSHDVQFAAARALALLVGKDAVPLIEAQLAGAPATQRTDLLGIIEDLDSEYFTVRQTPDSAYLLATWHRLMQSEFEDVRQFAAAAVVARENAQYVYDHPDLVKDPEERTRFQATVCLAQRGDARAIPLLRKALRDDYSPTRGCAFRGLIKYKPVDVLALLHEGLADPNLRGDAVCELVRRGDKAGTEELLRLLASLKGVASDREALHLGTVEIADLCNVIAERHLAVAEPALRQAYQNDCEDISRPVCGALAALGDREALARLREFAVRGRALARADAIKWLAKVGDRDSLPALRTARGDREPWVREAAEEAIEKLEALAAGGATPPVTERTSPRAGEPTETGAP